MLFAIADPATPPDLSGIPEMLAGRIVTLLAKSPDARPSLDEVTAMFIKALAECGLTDPGEAQRLASRA